MINKIREWFRWRKLTPAERRKEAAWIAYFTGGKMIK
jgi:hypothetical protein